MLNCCPAGRIRVWLGQQFSRQISLVVNFAQGGYDPRKVYVSLARGKTIAVSYVDVPQPVGLLCLPKGFGKRCFFDIDVVRIQ
jgi:hypothetical protein